MHNLTKEMCDGILEHYRQTAHSIGLEQLEVFLAQASKADDESLAKLRSGVQEMLCHQQKRIVREHEYVGDCFDVNRLLSLSKGDSTPTPFFYYGISVRVIELLLEGDIEQVMELMEKVDFSFSDTEEGKFGPITSVGLSDGVLRVDFLDC